MAPMTSSERSATAVFAAAVAVVALLIAGVAVAVTNNNDTGGGGLTAGGGGATAPVTIDVGMTEFRFDMPAEVPTGTVTFNISNNGSVAHNFAIPSLGVKTADIAPGASESVTVNLTEGSYDYICEIAGHADAGMKGSFAASAGAPTGGVITPSKPTDYLSMTPEQNDAMDLAMEHQGLRFLDPAEKSTYGGKIKEPTILPDGTKEWTLTAKIVDWEVERGRVVKAWTYDGTVPGPTLKANVGDKIRIVLINELPQSTSLHLHGIRVPNALDGVDPFTQKAQKPGETMVYEWTALEPAVGQYHSHHNAQMQIPDGMTGALIIGDYMNLAPEIMTRIGATEIVREDIMTLNDSGVIGLALNGKSYPATEPYVLDLGKSMVVHYFNEGLMGHPMHLHQPVGWIVAKDGHMLDVPMPADTVWVSPGERYTVVYTAVDPGVWAWHCHILTHAETPDGLKYMATALVINDPNAKAG
jgi:manganese oxidase